MYEIHASWVHNMPALRVLIRPSPVGRVYPTYTLYHYAREYDNVLCMVVIALVLLDPVG